MSNGRFLTNTADMDRAAQRIQTGLRSAHAECKLAQKAGTAITLTMIMIDLAFAFRRLPWFAAAPGSPSTTAFRRFQALIKRLAVLPTRR